MQREEAVGIPSARTIASDAEWEYAKGVLEREREGGLRSEFKIDRRDREHRRELNHSFLYLEGADGDGKLFALSRAYHLGAGNFGRVKIVEDEEGTQYALKILNEDTLKDRHQAFTEREGEILIKLKYFHGIGSLYSLYSNKQKTYIFQKLFPGITLLEYLKQYNLAHDQKILLAFKIAEAVAEVHNHNIVHGDIKPENFIVYQDNDKYLRVVLIDFGGAHQLNNSNEFYQGDDIMSTFGYAAPEVGLGRKQAQHRLLLASDIYSLGATFKHDLDVDLGTSGRYPFADLMVRRAPADRPTIKAVLEQVRSVVRDHVRDDAEDAARENLPPPDLKRQLIAKYKLLKIDWIAELKTILKDQLLSLANELNFVCVEKLDGTLEIIPGREEEFSENDIRRRKISEILTPYDYIVRKHKNDSVRDLAKDLSFFNKKLKSYQEKHPEKDMGDIIQGSMHQHIKNLMLDKIRKLVKMTNDIEDLNNFRLYLKNEEATEPFLRAERSFLRGRGSSGMTTSWQEAMRIIKRRALRLSFEESNLNKMITYPEIYRNILKERLARIFKLKSTHLKEFEKLLPKPPK